MGCNISTDRPSVSLTQIEKQLTEIELEVEKYKEVRSTQKMRLETTQDYLKHCLEVAQDNGFLDLITGNKSGYKEPFVSAGNGGDNTVSDHQISHPMQRDPYLAALIDQAKMQGWYIEPQEIELQELVTQGTTADVFRGRWRGLGVAVKCIFPDLFQSNENMINFFAQEVDTLSRQRHPFVLQLMGACLLPPNYGWIVTEFLSTNLKNWLHGSGKRCKERDIPLPPLKERLRMALEIAQAMHYLHVHKPKIIHRDLKPSNIFLDNDMHVRVADFGHARFLSDEEKALTGETGTYIYMAPEVIQSAPYDEKCDVYSFGVILNELITGDHPYIETDYGPSKIAMEVAKNGLRPALPMHNEWLKDMIELVQRLWDEDASNRPSFASIIISLTKFQDKL